MDVHQETHQFRHGERWVRVIEVNCRPRGEGPKPALLAELAPQDVLESGADKEVFLAQP